MSGKHLQFWGTREKSGGRKGRALKFFGIYILMVLSCLVATFVQAISYYLYIFTLKKIKRIILKKINQKIKRKEKEKEKTNPHAPLTYLP